MNIKKILFYGAILVAALIVFHTIKSAQISVSAAG